MADKNSYIRIRVSEKEKQKIEERAAAASFKSVSAYLRYAGLNNEIRDYSELIKLNYQIAKIGNNINQAARVMNTCFDYTDNDYLYICREFIKLKKLIETEMKK